MKKSHTKIKLQDRRGFTTRSKTVKIIRIKKAKVVKISINMIEKKALKLKKLEMKYNAEREKILNEKWEIINDKLRIVNE